MFPHRNHVVQQKCQFDFQNSKARHEEISLTLQQQCFCANLIPLDVRIVKNNRIKANNYPNLGKKILLRQKGGEKGTVTRK